ncbi:carboxymuconolactone decarboxylase family protein [Polaribacter litorisediminis]|uniref:carboxymuconolactone decarboxylase family protein n=1 Tax=Polaribacter litorisediminis TaxID=1908341 RepID=UPI001CBEAE75|nr:carboxymuconolactone decarboxylase family protein [Polaribacter litorisediminis]UAM99055.1 carboxymuconolactone decarboxylase family protein [Polaribacter litorisediminis]
MPFFKHLDELSDITDITWNDRKRLGPLDKASQRIMRGKSNFTYAQKELFAAYVSGLNACSFCYGSHVAVAKNFGVSTKLIEALVEDVDTSPVNHKEKLLFKYLKKLTLSASKLTQEDADDVFKAGWSEEDLHEVILVGCLFNFYNRLLDGHGIKGNPAIYQFGGEHLHKNGYGVPWFIGLIKGLIKKSKLKKLQEFKA